jgi:hypothetical protein
VVTKASATNTQFRPIKFDRLICISQFACLLTSVPTLVKHPKKEKHQLLLLSSVEKIITDLERTSENTSMPILKRSDGQGLSGK